MPQVNGLLLIAVLLLVVGFRDSSALSAAYGIAVTGEMLVTAVLLFVVMWWYARRERGLGQVSGCFLMGYGTLRFLVEFFREPDAHLGLLSLGLSMGQWLCLPMILVGAVLWRLGSRPD